MSRIWALIKWCYQRWGQVLCFLTAAATSYSALSSFTGAGIGESIIAIGWLMAGVLLRWQMLQRK